jgi:hypothetical protein
MDEVKPVEVKIKIGEIEVPRINFEAYIGKKERISDYRIMQGKYGYFVTMETSVVDEIQRGKETFELKATRLFGLFVDEKGNVGFGKDTELGLFLASKKVKDLDSLKGKEVTIQVKDKDGKKFLTFI